MHQIHTGSWHAYEEKINCWLGFGFLCCQLVIATFGFASTSQVIGWKNQFFTPVINWEGRLHNDL